ncbi:hypothetical protein MRB53_007427 [Persea americana]|uniref:Uncharacterized protein n=1 Tax=Persea americana TaxID=3435 RepID=A0ACC2MJ53_PERAE|nr:hypothetical protein MRB53_007427 [Persea americana]
MAKFINISFVVLLFLVASLLGVRSGCSGDENNTPKTKPMEMRGIKINIKPCIAKRCEPNNQTCFCCELDNACYITKGICQQNCNI